MTAQAAARKAKGKRAEFYRRSMQVLQNANIPFLIAGAGAVRFYTGVSRQTKDFDLHLRPHHIDGALDAFAHAGYKTEKTFPHWLAKAKRGRNCVDLISRLRNENSVSGSDRLCRGTLLSRQQYLWDVEERGFRDARLEKRAHMNEGDIAHWTKAIAKGNKARETRR